MKRKPVLLVKEIFETLQGEGTQTGLTFTFVRLSGCNLRCHYCDTAYAFKGGEKMSVEAVVDRVKELGHSRVLITGGEPLLQRPVPSLVSVLSEAGFHVSIETHGEQPVDQVAGKAKLIMDIKTPSSGECRGGFAENLPKLSSSDEVKFVLASEEDYDWAKEILAKHPFPTKQILFSPAQPHPDSPGTFAGIPPKILAEKIVKDRLAVRFQLQLHKLIQIR